MEKLESIHNYYKRVISSDYTKPIWNNNILNPQWNYVDGIMMTALMSIYKVTHEEEILEFVENFTNQYINDDGSIKGFDYTHYSADDLAESRVLFDLYEYTKDDIYLAAIQYSKKQLEDHPRTSTGVFWHNKDFKDQVWLDGLYMIHPFYTRYINLNDPQKNYYDIISQFIEVKKVLQDPITNLYLHGYDESRVSSWSDNATGRSKNYWLRSIGWHVAALVDTAEYLDNAPGKELLSLLLKELIDALIPYKDEKTNLFYQVIDKKDVSDNYLETSGSALIAYSILKGVRLNMLSSSYKEMGLSIFNGLLEHKLSNENEFRLKDICLTAALGNEPNTQKDGSIAYYLSEPIVENNPKGIAPLLMAYSEVIQK